MAKRCTSIGLMSVRNNDGIQDGRQNYIKNDFLDQMSVNICSIIAL